MVDSREKGNRFERAVCVLLSQWFLPETDWSSVRADQLPFRRRFTITTPLSGHWRGAGDVLHRPDIEFPFAVEAKIQERWTFDGLLSPDGWLVWKWWAQAKAQADGIGRLPLLFFSRKFRPVYYMIREDVKTCLEMERDAKSFLCAGRPDGEVVFIGLASQLMGTNPSRLCEWAKCSPTGGGARRKTLKGFIRKPSP